MVNSTGTRGRECKLINGHKCTLHTKRRGFPKSLSQPCKACSEWRCKKHCRCGRQGTATGRSAARIYGVAQQPAPKAMAQAKAKAAAAPVHPRAPVGPPPVDSCLRLRQADWWADLVEAVANSREIELATYMFDDLQLFRVLLGRLTDGSRFSLRINIDAEAIKGNTPAEQRGRLDRLRRAGAAVYACKGDGRLGAYHVKELVVDRRFMFTGSANFTTKGRTANRERGYKMTGANVALALSDQAAERASGTLWVNHHHSQTSAPSCFVSVCEPLTSPITSSFSVFPISTTCDVIRGFFVAARWSARVCSRRCRVHSDFAKPPHRTATYAEVCHRRLARRHKLHPVQRFFAFFAPHPGSTPVRFRFQSGFARPHTTGQLLWRFIYRPLGSSPPFF